MSMPQCLASGAKQKGTDELIYRSVLAKTQSKLMPKLNTLKETYA